MDIMLDSDERQAHEPSPRTGLFWSLAAGAAGLTLLTMTAMRVGIPAEGIPAQPAVPAGPAPTAYVSTYSPREEGFLVQTTRIAEADVVITPAHQVIPIPKPVLVAVATPDRGKSTSRPVAAVRPSTSPVETSPVETDTVYVPDAPIAPAPRMSMLDERFDDTPDRPGPLRIARSVLVDVAMLPLTAWSFGRNAVETVVRGE